MNMILLFPEDFTAPDRVILRDYRAEHIRDILRAPVGKKLNVGLVQKGKGEGEILVSEKNNIELKVKISETATLPSNISLILAMPRPQTFKKVLETIGTFGVKELLLVPSERSQKSFFDSKLLKNEGWMKHLRLGLEQGEKTYLPQLTSFRSLKQCFEKISPSSLRLLAHPETKDSLWKTKLASEKFAGDIVIAVGPEGGWLDDEVAQFTKNNFQTIRLGDTLHRVENAVTAVLAQIEIFKAKAD